MRYCKLFEYKRAGRSMHSFICGKMSTVKYYVVVCTVVELAVMTKIWIRWTTWRAVSFVRLKERWV